VKIKGAWRYQNLSEAQHVNNAGLIQAAYLKNDQDLLRDIEGADLVAIELGKP